MSFRGKKVMIMSGKIVYRIATGVFIVGFLFDIFWWLRR